MTDVDQTDTEGFQLGIRAATHYVRSLADNERSGLMQEVFDGLANDIARISPKLRTDLLEAEQVKRKAYSEGRASAAKDAEEILYQIPDLHRDVRSALIRKLRDIE